MSRWQGWGLPVLALLLLSGCADAQLGSLAQQLEKIRQAPGVQQPLVVPNVPEYQPVAYVHEDKRSPFLAPEAVAGFSVPVQTVSYELAPDTSRDPEPLERFSLQELRLVGMLKMNDRQRALVRTPEGDVVSVSEGNYIGPDYGRIVRIGDTHIEVNERIFTQTSGWQIRDVTLTIGNGE
ncbi:pilus assembly protein PilP [Halomonas sp. LS-001]